MRTTPKQAAELVSSGGFSISRADHDMWSIKQEGNSGSSSSTFNYRSSLGGEAVGSFEQPVQGVKGANDDMLGPGFDDV